MKHLIGVDLGGTRLRAVRMDTTGHIFQHRSVATAATAGPEEVISQVVSLVEQVIGDVSLADILGIGVGSPGPTDPFAGIVLHALTLQGWVNVPLRALLEDQTGLPVILHNDAHAAALGEWYFGSGQGCQDFVYVTVSTGIGGGIIANGQLLLGRKGLAGEIGHMQIQSDGPVCSCGQTGCWESLASGTALARFAVQALQRKSPSLLHDSATKGPLTAAQVVAAATQGDEMAQDLLRREGEFLGMGLVNLLHLFSPERITLGGGVAQAMAWLEPHMHRIIAARALPSYRDVPIHYAHLGDQAGVIGAATRLLASVTS